MYIQTAPSSVRRRRREGRGGREDVLRDPSSSAVMFGDTRAHLFSGLEISPPLLKKKKKKNSKHDSDPPHFSFCSCTTELLQRSAVDSDDVYRERKQTGLLLLRLFPSSLPKALPLLSASYADAEGAPRTTDTRAMKVDIVQNRVYAWINDCLKVTRRQARTRQETEEGDSFG